MTVLQDVIKMLFHYTNIEFDLPRLFLYFAFYLITACLTLGPFVIVQQAWVS